ncbi:MAG: hypothetical protein IJ809_05435 [Clostridia bacterium]|nr:hypothetical protein [Clostridia bacterium]
MKIKTKKLEFPKEIKDKCDRYLSRKNLEITYLNGYMMEFKNTNFSTISPHKILMKSKDKEVIILYYGEHLYDEELFFINNTKNGCSFQKLRELVVNYF